MSIADALKHDAATEATYRCRANTFGAERVWRLTPQALIREGRPDLIIRYEDIARIRIFSVVGVDVVGSGPLLPAASIVSIKRERSLWRVLLSDTHTVGIGKFENRSRTFRPFMERLLKHAEEASPRLAVITGMPHTLWLIWAGILVLLGVVAAFSLAIFGMVAWHAANGLANGNYHAVTFSGYADGALALMTAFFFGSSIKALAGTLRRQRERKLWPQPHPAGPHVKAP